MGNSTLTLNLMDQIPRCRLRPAWQPHGRQHRPH